MHAAVLQELAGTAIFVGTAAVADYRPIVCAEQKIKKKSDALTLPMARTADILADVAARLPRPFVVGFAAETQALEQHAHDKLVAKRLDLIAANEVGHAKAFDTDENSLLLLWPGGRRELPRASKCELARALTSVIIEHYLERQAMPAGARCELASAGARDPSTAAILGVGSG
jgi:phosphopantothenoylcysteine decarboxylase/phosphopantothenate--cysteine ligase